MCWSATSSFVTLAVGTVLNVASYALLRRWGSPTSSLVWSWQFALLMQIPEGIVWLQLDAGHDDLRVASRTAMILNVAQPLALLMGIRLGGLYRGEFRYAYVAMLLYLVVLLSQMDEVWSHAASIAPRPGCAHLDLRYWTTSRGLVYVVTSLLVVSEARPLLWAVVNAGIFTVTLVLAMVVYPCGTGSVWCWFIFVAGPILVGVAAIERRRRPTPPPLPTTQRRTTTAVAWRRPTI